MNNKAFINKKIKSNESLFFNRVFGLMSIGLLITAFVAYYTAMTPQLFAIASKLGLLLVIGTFGLVIAISAGMNRFSSSTLLTMFIVYAGLNGLTFSFIFMVYAKSVIYQAFFSTAGMFGAMSIYGYTTKKDLSGLGSILFMALIGIIIASVINIFMKSSQFSLLISIGGVVIFSLLTAYDIQKLKVIQSQITSEEQMHKVSVFGALSLYLDFINIFVYMLRLFSQRD